jgi:glycosyltransferase involved in cell wall biosynthesis
VPDRDVAIYAPFSAYFFEGSEGASGSLGGKTGGGAELQMVLLGRALAAAGIRTGLITYPVEGGAPRPGSGPDLVERAAHDDGKLAEFRNIWGALKRADAQVSLFRGSGPQVFVGGVFSRRYRRKLVFSAANDLDFDFARTDRGRLQLRAYRSALMRADVVVVQREEQLELARAAGVERLELIPSFAERAEPVGAEPEGFLWVNRLVSYKNPLAYIRLAESLPDVRFRMISPRTTETTDALTREVHGAAAQVDNLELLDQVPRKELLELVSRSTAVVSTSSAEGMPNTFLEAWARGVPVVSLDYDPDGKLEALGVGRFAHGSEERLRQAVAELWNQPERRRELGEAGRRYVGEVHSPEAVGRQWADLFRRLLDER